MKKTSLFILLILLTFSLSKSNIKLHFQSKQAYIGIREIDKMYDYISQKMNLPKKTKEIIKEELNFLEFCDTQSRSSSDCLSTPNKLREFKINSYHLEAEVLKIREDMVLYFIYYYDVIIEKPPKYERKCERLGVVKKCKNVEIRQNLDKNDQKEIDKEIKDRIIVDAFVDLPNLPKEDYEKYKQILRFKFPNNKNLK